MAVTYTKEQKQKLYAIALDALSMYDVDNASLLKFVDRLSSGIVREGGKNVLQVSVTKSGIEGIAAAIFKLISKTEKTFKPSDTKAVTPYNKLLSFLDNTQNVINSFKNLNDSIFTINKKNSNLVSTFNSSLADTQGSNQILDLIRSSFLKEDRPQPTRDIPNSALADTKGSTQELDLIRDSRENKQIIDGFTESGKNDLKDAFKGVLQCICDDKALRPIPTQTQVPQTGRDELKQQTGSGVTEKLLLGAGLTYVAINALKNLFTKKTPVEVPKPAPKTPVEAPKPAPKTPVEVPKPAPKTPVEVPKPAPKTPVEVPKTPVEVPKPTRVKVPKLDEVVPKIKIPLSPEPKKPWEPLLPAKTKAPFKPTTVTPKLEDVVPKIKVPSTVAKPLEKEAIEVGSKYAAKQGAKTLGKKIPFGVSALIGAGLAAERAYAGDWTGAGLELLSGVAGTMPGIGTAISLGTDAAIITRDAKSTSLTDNKDNVLPSAVPQPLPPPKLVLPPKKEAVKSSPKSIDPSQALSVKISKPTTPEPRQKISPEEAAQIKKNIEDQVKNLNTDPKYLLTSKKTEGATVSLQNNKESSISKNNITNESFVTIAGFTKNSKKELIDIITVSLSKMPKSLLRSVNEDVSQSVKKTETLPTFTDKLLNSLPENKFTKSLKTINNINKDPQVFRENLKQRAQDTVLNKVQKVFNSSSTDTSSNLTFTSPVSKGKNSIIDIVDNSFDRYLPSTTGKAAGKSLATTTGKAAGKGLLKKIPGIGALAGLGFAANRLLSGDMSGAGLELLSGVAGAIPGIGTAGSIGIDALLAAKDATASRNTVEQVGDVAKVPDNIKPDGGLVVKSPRENSLFKPIQLSKNDGVIAAPFAKEGKIDTQNLTGSGDKQLPVLQDILKSSGSNNEQLNRLTDAIFKLAQAALNQPATSPTVIRQQIPVQTSQQHSTAQIASSNVDPIRAIRLRFGV